MRLAIISTPRSGNTWVRALLASLLDLEERPVHFPEEIDWEHLPDRCVIQIHWYPENSFLENLERHSVRVLVLARHPLDVLVSWLNYVYYAHEQGGCPGKETCDKCDLIGVMPRSEALIEYARGKAGQWFFNHSPAWWTREGVIRVRYEELVAEPEVALGRLLEEIGEPPRKPLAEVLKATSISEKKPSNTAWLYHYWQGQPGLWRTLIPAKEATALASVRPEPFEILGYPCDPDESLENDRADINWLKLQLDSTRENLAIERSKRRKKTRELETEQTRSLQRENEVTQVRASLVQTYRALADECVSHLETLRKLEETDSRLNLANASLSNLGAESTVLKIALGMRRISTRLPGLSGWRIHPGGETPKPRIRIEEAVVNNLI